MAHPTEHIPVAVLKEAHRNGIRVFLVATALQLLIYALTMTTIVVRLPSAAGRRTWVVSQ